MKRLKAAKEEKQKPCTLLGRLLLGGQGAIVANGIAPFLDVFQFYTIRRTSKAVKLCLDEAHRTTSEFYNRLYGPRPIGGKWTYTNALSLRLSAYLGNAHETYIEHRLMKSTQGGLSAATATREIKLMRPWRCSCCNSVAAELSSHTLMTDSDRMPYKAYFGHDRPFCGVCEARHKLMSVDEFLSRHDRSAVFAAAREQRGHFWTSVVKRCLNAVLASSPMQTAGVRSYKGVFLLTDLHKACHRLPTEYKMWNGCAEFIASLKGRGSFHRVEDPFQPDEWRGGVHC